MSGSVGPTRPTGYHHHHQAARLGAVVAVAVLPVGVELDGVALRNGVVRPVDPHHGRALEHVQHLPGAARVIGGVVLLPGVQRPVPEFDQVRFAANALFLAAASRGHLSIAAAIAALYPASTVLLALAVDRERLRPAQAVGLGLAADALVLASV